MAISRVRAPLLIAQACHRSLKIDRRDAKSLRSEGGLNWLRAPAWSLVHENKLTCPSLCSLRLCVSAVYLPEEVAFEGVDGLVFVLEREHVAGAGQDHQAGP